MRTEKVALSLVAKRVWKVNLVAKTRFYEIHVSDCFDFKATGLQVCDVLEPLSHLKPVCWIVVCIHRSHPVALKGTRRGTGCVNVEEQVTQTTWFSFPYLLCFEITNIISNKLPILKLNIFTFLLIYIFSIHRQVYQMFFCGFNSPQPFKNVLIFQKIKLYFYIFTGKIKPTIIVIVTNSCCDDQII